MKKKLILSLRNLETKTKNKKVILNLPNSPLLKVKNDFEFFYNQRWKYAKNIINDYKYLNQIYEENLKLISNYLNKYQKVNFSKKYWRIIIGFWLYKFICVVFERWHSLKEVNSNYKKINVEILKYDFVDFIPFGIEDFTYFNQTDSWNKYIYFEIINNFKFNSIDRKYLKNSLVFKDKKEIYRRLRYRNNNYKNKIFFKFQKFFLKNNQNLDYFVFDTCLSNLEEIRMNIKLNNNPIFFKSIKFNDLYPSLILSKNNISDKRNIDPKFTKNNFEIFLSKFCLKNIPKCYLEHYKLTVDVLKSHILPKKPKVIFTTLGINRSTLMDFYIAKKVTLGSKLVLAQHGGNYGQHQAHWSTTHEPKISERFLTWGFRENKKTIPLGIIKKIQKVKYDKNSKLILLEIRNRNLFSHALKIDAGAINSKIYIKELNNFFLNLKDNEIVSKLRMKLHDKDFGLQEKKFFLKTNSKLKFIKSKKPTKFFYNKSRLIINSYASSSHLECMASNMPMLILYVHDLNLLKKDTKEYFIKFKKLGILHSNHKSLYSKLCEIHKEPEKWWLSREIQSIRKKYVNDFAIHNKMLVEDIVKNLIKVTKN